MRFLLFAALATAVCLPPEGASFSPSRAINLDLIHTPRLLALAEEAYLKQNTSSCAFAAEILKEENVFLSPSVDKQQFRKYEVSRRAEFDGLKMEYAFKNGPNFVVTFKDTDTVLVPSESTMGSAQKRDSLHEYYEYSIGDRAKIHPQLEDILIPASPCISFPTGKGSGSVGVGYLFGVNISPSGGLSGSISDGLALSVALGANFALSASYSVKHSCSSSDGKAVRLFYQVGTVVVEPRRRSLVYDGLKSILFSDKWMEIGHQKYLTDTTPKYYCGTEDKIALMCGKAGVEFTDENGSVIRLFLGAGATRK